MALCLMMATVTTRCSLNRLILKRNCYFRLPFKYDASNLRAADYPVIRGKQYSLKEVRGVVHDYINSYFYSINSHFATTCASTYCAVFGLHVPIMMDALAEGGDGNGAFDILESAMLGKENAATLDPSVFIDDNEWRKCAHFALHKKRVCIKEAKNGTATNKYNIDVVKRFVAGEELIVRANFGFSSEVRFDRMKKHQSCNCVDVNPMISVPKSMACPQAREEVKSVAKKSPTDSIGRRFLASAVGLATLVSVFFEVCHEEGRFLKNSVDILEGILSSSAASHVYFCEILQPAWDELGGEAVLISVLQPEIFKEHMRSSTDWYVRRVCNLDTN